MDIPSSDYDTCDGPLSSPKYAHFSDEDIRMSTFVFFPRSIPSVQKIAQSGFFFLGTYDRVQCFHCGLVLCKWEEDDIPDEEHEEKNHQCEFIRRKKHRECASNRDVREDVPKEILEVDDLRRETRRLAGVVEELRSRQTCHICMDKPISNGFLPCRHVVCCDTCADILQSKKCPICNARIEQSLPLYIT